MQTEIKTQSLESLLERVRAATGPDRELDAEIMDTLVREAPRPADAMFIGPAYTSSLDACASLQAEKLPGSMEAVWNMEEGPGARLLIPVKNSEWKLFEATGNTVCLAWLAAILSALIAKGEEVKP